MHCEVEERSLDDVHNKYYNSKIENKRGIIFNPGALKVEEFTFLTHPLDTCIRDCLLTGVLFEKFILSYCKQFINPDKNIIDLGANIGVYSVVLSSYLNKTKVYAFEPQPVIFNILNENIKLNNCDNIVAYNYGASDTESTFYMNASYDKKENMGAFRICDNSTDLKILCKPIDLLNLDNIGYIKIDVEGHELQALIGMQNTIKKCTPILQIEIHEDSPTRTSTFNFIESVGYKKYHKLTHCDYIFFM
jgi:FkbM family methyltransferase